MINNSRRQARRGPGVGRPQQARANGRARSNGGQSPEQSYQRYLTLARDAAANGDHVATEYYYQHADHYFRMMSKQPA